MTKPTPAPVRFWAKVDKTGSCWLWTARLDRYGYGQFNPRQGGPIIVKAHRYAYELVTGPIPEGMQLDHLCRIRHCVNPAHLDPVTGRVNSLRGYSPPAVNARRTRCKEGHTLSERTARSKPGGIARYCRTCNNAAGRRSRERAMQRAAGIAA